MDVCLPSRPLRRRQSNRFGTLHALDTRADVTHRTTDFGLRGDTGHGESRRSAPMMRGSTDASPGPGSMLQRFFHSAACLHAAKTAIVAHGRRLAYAELQREALRLAAALRERGRTPRRPCRHAAREFRRGGGDGLGDPRGGLRAGAAARGLAARGVAAGVARRRAALDRDRGRALRLVGGDTGGAPAARWAVRLDAEARHRGRDRVAVRRRGSGGGSDDPAGAAAGAGAGDDGRGRRGRRGGEYARRAPLHLGFDRRAQGRDAQPREHGAPRFARSTPTCGSSRPT